MKQTPMMKLIEYIENYDDVPKPILAKAAELLAEERDAIEIAYYEGSEKCHLTQVASRHASYYFTQTYGGGDE